MTGNLNKHDDWSITNVTVAAGGTVTSSPFIRSDGVSMGGLVVGGVTPATAASLVNYSLMLQTEDGSEQSVMAPTGDNTNNMNTVPGGTYRLVITNASTVSATIGVVAVVTVLG